MGRGLLFRVAIKFPDFPRPIWRHFFNREDRGAPLGVTLADSNPAVL
jgi:hypothetical protein